MERINKTLPVILVVLSIPIIVNIWQSREVFTNPNKVIAEQMEGFPTPISYPVSYPTIGNENDFVTKNEVIVDNNVDQVDRIQKPIDRKSIENKPVKQEPIVPEVPVSYPQPESKCLVSGCSGQLCVDRDAPTMITTCEWLPVYACYEFATCEEQESGQCGWTYSDNYNQCYEESSK